VFRQPAGSARWLATAVLAWTWATLGMIGLGMAGLLTLGPLAAWSALGLLAGGVGFLVRKPVPAVDTGPDRGESWTWCEAVALGLVLAAGLPLGLASLLGPVKVVSDGPIYHLYFAVRWWKAGRLFLVPVPFGENAAPYFPAAGDLWFTWLTVGWAGDRLAKVGQVPFLLLSGLAARDLCRRLGASRAPAAMAVGWFLTSTPLLWFAFEPNVDTIFVAGYLTAVAFFVRYGMDPASRAGALMLGGLAAGGAWATKPTGTVFVPPLLLVAAAIVLVRVRTWRARAAHLAVLVLAAGIMTGFWFGRNAVLTGNPLYPLDVARLGWVGWYGPDVMRLSPYYIPRADWRALADILLAVLDPRLVPFWLAAVLGGWALGRAREPGDAWIALLSALAVANVVLYWVCVPYRTQQRFFLQALGLASVPLARLFARAAVLRWVGVGLLAVHVLTAQGWPFVPAREQPPWDLSTLVPNAVAPPILLAGWLPRLAFVAGAILVVVAVLRLRARPGPSRLLAAVIAVAVGVGLTCFLVQSPISGAARTDPFYPRFEDFYQGWLELDRRCGARGKRIAYAGTNIPYYLFGRGLRNDVRYVNVQGPPGWLLHDFHREAIARGKPHWEAYPRPGWDRADPDYRTWLSNLDAAGIQLLVVTRVNPAEGPHNVADREGFPIERIWADGNPGHFELLYGAAEHDPWFRIYRVR
jgi:hypothetical protein